MELSWLPAVENWDEQLRVAKDGPLGALGLELRRLAGSRMQFVQVGKLDRVLQRSLAAHGAEALKLRALRLAVLGSATTSHLVAGLRVGGLRHGLALEVYEGPYAMYQQELMDAGSGLHAFAPQAVLFALDARHLMGGEGSTPEEALALMRRCWRLACSSFGCQVLQQTVLPVLPALLGNNEERMAGSGAAKVSRLNGLLRTAAAEEGVDLVAVDRMVERDGLAQWHDAGSWYRNKHEVHPVASESYGEQVVRVVAAGQGMSAKCLVLDLDNTLWGGVVGDDGVEGLVLGQGSAAGEAFVELQRYAKALRGRGVLLAVCSKNEERNALEVFERHPEMVLRREEIACFVANWRDKAENLRAIAKRLNIGLDALVFVDDNPSERALVRRELPMVRVPEMPEDPVEFVRTLSAAGYFEAVRLTEEDGRRGELYEANERREQLRESSTDMEGYLASLQMVMEVRPFDAMGLGRVTQLINKTNQFNLTTERLQESEVALRMRGADWVTLQVRLRDRFGDNGVIAVLMARLQGEVAEVASWLMSCRVLGRRVEVACLHVLAERCAARGAKRLVGMYRPTEKNGMVRELYAELGFSKVAEEDGASRWELALREFVPQAVPMQVLWMSERESER